MRTYQKNMSRNRSGIDEVSNYYFRNNINGSKPVLQEGLIC